MKKITKVLLPLTAITTASVVIAPILSSCSCGSTPEEKEVKVQEVKFNQEYSWVQTDSTREFGKEVKVLPENATNKSLTWKISDESSAKVAQVVDEKTGTVKGLNTGYAKLTCTSNDGTGKSSEQWIVVGKYVELTGFKIDATKTVELDTSVQLKPTYTPSDATTALNEDVLWSTSDPDVVEVDQNGKLTAMNVGVATITAIPYDWDYTTSSIELKESLKAECTVTVSYAPVEQIVVTPSSTYKEPGNTFKVVPTILPHSAKQSWNYYIVDESIVSYDKDSMIATALKEGTTSIVFYDEDQTLANTCKVTVQTEIVPVVSIDFQSKVHEMTEGNTWEPSISVIGESGKTPTITGYWLESSNTDVAVVDPANPKQIIAKSAGTATLTVHSDDGVHTNTCTLTVNQKIVPVTGVTLPATADCLTGKTITLNPTISPDDATDKTVYWQSSVETVATVNDNGVVSGLKPGTSIIKVITKDGGYSATCTVTVKDEFKPITSIEIDSSVSINPTGTKQLTAKVNDEASYKYVKWVSSDESVATVKSIDGLTATLTAKAAGTAQIFAYAQDGSAVKSNVCNVTCAYAPIETFELKQSSLVMVEGGYTKLLAPTITPESACQEYEWYSSNPYVATVDKSGHLSALMAGVATITCKSVGVDASGEHKTASITLTVIYPIIHVEDIELSYTSAEVFVGEDNLAPTVTYKPESATETGVYWTSNDTTNVKFNGTLLYDSFYCRKPGDYELYCIPIDNPSVTKVVKIKAVAPDPEYIELTCKKPMVNINGHTIITSTVWPYAASQEVTYKSSNPEIVDVGENTGICIGYHKGVATITATSVVNPRLTNTIEIYCTGYASFAKDDWATVCSFANRGLDALHKRYAIDCELNENFPGTLIGYQKKIYANGAYHKVRVIGENHDDLADGSGKAALTFELTNIFGDDKDPFSTCADEQYNYNYVDSILRYNLTGEGKCKSSMVWSTTAIDSIKEGQYDLYKNLKSVTKKVATNPTETPGFGNYVITDYNDKLFSLTAHEMAIEGSSSCTLDEGTPYAYWSKFNTGEDRAHALYYHSYYHGSYYLSSPYIMDERHGNYYCGIIDSGEIRKVDAPSHGFNFALFAFCI